MNATKVKIELVRELGVFDVTWETVKSGTVSEIIFVVTDEDYATKNEGFLGYILEQNKDGGKAHWKECSERYLLDCQAYRFTYDGKLHGTHIRNDEVIKTIGVTKWTIMKRKMDAVKELYNAEADLQRFLQETKQNIPIKTSETALVTQNSVEQKDNSESLKIPVSWEKKIGDNDSQVRLLVKELMLFIV